MANQRPVWAKFSLAFCLATGLEAQIGAPSAGFVRYDGMPIQAMYGVPANLVTGPSAFGPAEALSFGDREGLLAAGGRIRLVRADGSVVAEADGGESHPLLNVEGDRATAIAWLPATRSLLWWNGKDFSRVAVDDTAIGANVTSVGLTSTRTAQLLISESDGSVMAVEVSLPQGIVVSVDLLPGVKGPAVQTGHRLIWRDGAELAIESADGVRYTLALSAPGPFVAERMSSHWIHLYFPKNDTHWGLELNEKAPTLSRLPVPALRKPRAGGGAR